jgi:predicted negative regulator of RcsB-dependent stress response
VRRSRSHFFAGVCLAAIATSGVHAQAVPKAADRGGDDPLSAIAGHLGLPVGVVLALGLLWGLISQADKLRLVWGWLRAGLVKKPGGQSEPEPADPSPKAPASPALHNLPPPCEGFVARDEPLHQLAIHLVPEGSQVVVHGLPGVGKTTLALQYARENRDRYPGGTWWLDASEGFAPLARRACAELEATIPGLPPGTGLEPEPRLRRCLQAWPGEPQLPVLLVVDNLPPGREGRELLQRLRTGLPSRFRCLITQRAEPLAAAAAIDLPVLAPGDALHLLQNRAGESGRQRIAQEPEAALQLVADVEGLPLALVLLAAHLQRVPVLQVSQLREDLARPELGAEAFQQAHADLLAEKGLVASLLTSWRPLSPQARLLAQLLSLTLSAPIPWELIQRCEPAEASTAPGQFWYAALADLLGANLLDRLAGERQRYALHPLVRQFFAIQRQGWPEEAAWRQRLAAAAEALGQLVEGEDASGAVEYWRQACLADPNQASAAFSLGYGLIRLGDSRGALGAFEQARHQAEAAQDQRGIFIACNGIGDVLMAQGDRPGALAAYQAGLAIREGLAQRDPANTEWQRDLSVSHDRIGNVLVAQGDGPGALAAYQAGLAIAEGLAQRDPANTEWQRDLFVSKTMIGNVLVAQGDGPGALAAYQAGLVIAEGLAQRDPANTEWQRDLSVSKEKIGNVLVAQGDGQGALAAYQAGLAIREGLAQRDPANTEWQRDLSVSKIKIGDVLVAQGDGPGALAAYQAGLAIREGLAQRDPANTQWQVDVAISCGRLGSLSAVLPISTRKEYLVRGREILLALKRAERLHASQDATRWFDQAIHGLGEGRYKRFTDVAPLWRSH